MLTFVLIYKMFIKRYKVTLQYVARYFEYASHTILSIERNFIPRRDFCPALPLRCLRFCLCCTCVRYGRVCVAIYNLHVMGSEPFT